jgi:flagellin
MNILDGSFNGHTASDAMGRGATVNIPDMSTIGLGIANFDVTRMPLGGDGRADFHASAARTSALGNQLTNAQNNLVTRNAELGVARDNFATASGDFARAEVDFQMAEVNYNSSRERLNDAMIDAGVTSIDQLMNTDPSTLSDAAANEIMTALRGYNEAAIAMGSDSLGLAAVTDAAALENWGIGGTDQPAQIQADDVNYGRGVDGATRTAAQPATGAIGDFDAARDAFNSAQLTFDSAVFARDQAQATVGRIQSMVTEASADTRAAFSSSSLNVLDRAISQVNSARASLGAISNRFDHTVASNNVSMLNQAAARSRIVDLDVARETSNLRRLQILQQYQIANQRNQQQTAATMMLSLLG